MTYPHQVSKAQREQDRDAFKRKVARIYKESDTWSEFKIKAAIVNCWTFLLSALSGTTIGMRIENERTHL